MPIEDRSSTLPMAASTPQGTTSDPPNLTSNSKADGDSKVKSSDAISIATAFGSGAFLRAISLLFPTNKIYALVTLVVLYFVIFITAGKMLCIIFRDPPPPRTTKAINFMLKFLLILSVVALLVEFYVHLPDERHWMAGLACGVALVSGGVMKYFDTWVSTEPQSDVAFSPSPN
ncbi:hypothetical protein AMTRI_Chr05g74080 [Amborella trichopoda]